MKLRLSKGFRGLKAVGLISFLFALFTIPPVLLSSRADATFVIPSLIGIALGIAGYLFSLIDVELNSVTKRISARRPYWPGKTQDFQWNSSFKVLLTERQHRRGLHFIPLLVLDGGDEFYLEKPYYGIRSNERALEDFQKLQQTVYGEIRSREMTASSHGDEWRPKGYEAVLSFFGMPVELDTDRGNEKPWLTWSIAIVTIAISVVALYLKPEWIERYGFLSTEPNRHGGLTWISTFFLHAGWFHLVGNMYFLLIFGDNVELYLGRLKYTALLALSTAGAAFLQMVSTSGQSVLLIGASGGIFGVVTFYLLQFPNKKFGMILFNYWRKVPAKALFALFLITQLIGMAALNDGVAYFAHAGGMIVGLAFAAGGLLSLKPRPSGAQPNRVMAKEK